MSRWSKGSYEEALACKPPGCTRTVCYCECGDYFKTAKDWITGLCRWCRMDEKEGRRSGDE